MRTGYSPPPFVRTNCPTVNADYTILPTDLGCVMGVPGLTITLPLLAQKLPGKYTVKNNSTGEGYVITTGSDVITFSNQSVTTTETREVIEFDAARDFNLDTTNNAWFTS